MGKKFTVKARTHHGTDSLDITIPTQVCRENKINEGDVFSFEITEEGKLTILKYTRIFENK
jgi:bifunctional DNA-binding transcriptional regulator/antitoxin component of YhaV-PrlF toxin-antitoxin module